MRIIYSIIFILITSISSYAENTTTNENIEKAILFLKMACVAGGEKLTVEGNAEVGLTLKKWKKAGVQASIRVNKEEVNGLVGSLDILTSQNAQDTRECMKPYIGQIMNALFPPVDDPEENMESGKFDAQANENNATSSGATAHNTCAAYAGPEGANSTCARDDGIGVSTGVSKNSAQGVGKNSNSN